MIIPQPIRRHSNPKIYINYIGSIPKITSWYRAKVLHILHLLSQKHSDILTFFSFPWSLATCQICSSTKGQVVLAKLCNSFEVLFDKEFVLQLLTLCSFLTLHHSWKVSEIAIAHRLKDLNGHKLKVLHRLNHIEEGEHSLNDINLMYTPTNSPDNYPPLLEMFH